MKIFQSVLKNFESVGIRQNQSRLNGKVLLAFTLYWSGTIFDCVYIVRELSSFDEIVATIFLLSATTAIAMCFTVFVLSSKKLFNILNRADHLTDKCMYTLGRKSSRCQNWFYQKHIVAIKNNPTMERVFKMTIHRIDKWNRMIYLCMSKGVPLVVIWPTYIASFIIYYTSDLGEDAFTLPTPVW